MKIIDAGQYVSLEGSDAGQLRCRITIRMDDGRQVSIPTSEETVNQIIELMHGLTPSGSVEAPPPVKEVAAFFGGDVMTSVPSPSIGDISEESAAQQPEPPPALGRPAPRARTVAKDEYGYPIVPQRAEQAPDIADEEDPGEQI